MREFLKVICVLVLGAAIIAAAIAWAHDRPDTTTWVVRWASIPVGLIGLLGFLKMHFKADHAPDFLHRYCGRYFDRNGLCFAIVPSVVDGVCVLNALFQNRYEGACTGMIVLRHSGGLFGQREFANLAVRVDCDGGAFGVIRIPISIPSHMQGKNVNFEVGASVDYPSGKGLQLRFRDGIVLRADTNFSNTFSTTVTVLGALGGAIVISSPAKTKIRLPSEVAECLSSGTDSRQEILWRPGDEPSIERSFLGATA